MRTEKRVMSKTVMKNARPDATVLDKCRLKRTGAHNKTANEKIKR